MPVKIKTKDKEDTIYYNLTFTGTKKELRGQFKAWCATRGFNMNEKLIDFIEGLVKADIKSK